MAGTITALVLQKGNHERVNVFLDGEFAFALDLMAAASLHKGQTLDDADILALQDQDAAHRAYLSAVRLIGIRPRSQREIEQALLRKQFDAAAIDTALDRLRTEGLVDDAEFARFWTENRSQFRPRSERALRYELRQKGVASEDVDLALEAIDDEVAAWDALMARPSLWRGRLISEAEPKVLAFLARRGFSFGVAQRVWRRLTTEPPE